MRFLTRKKHLIIFGAAILLIIVIAGALIWIGSLTYSYNRFKGDLRNCILYVENNDNLRADHEGISVHVSPRNAQFIYNELLNGGYYENDFITPQEDGLVLDFGNGYILKIWEAENSGVNVLFIDPDQNEFKYQTSETTRYSALLILSSIKGANYPNEPWASGNWLKSASIYFTNCKELDNGSLWDTFMFRYWTVPIVKCRRFVYFWKEWCHGHIR